MIGKIKGLRWYIAGLLCLASGLNYLDRLTLSVLAKTIQDELHITTIQYAHVTSAFLISYTLMCAVGGWLVDTLGTRRSFLYFVGGWSVANALHAVAQSALQLSVFRFLLGATEPINFPAGIKAVSEWFPMRERALAVGIFNGGVAVGAAVAVPVVSWIALGWGWRSAFVVGGSLGFLWLAAWALFYRLPREHARLSAEELALIEEGESPSENKERVPLMKLFSTRQVWGCVLIRMLLDPCSYFFVFWMTMYLQKERGFDLATIGKYNWIPFVALALGNLTSGVLPQTLMKFSLSYNRARLAVIVGASCVIPLCCYMITKVANPMMAMALISVAMFCHGTWGFMAIPAEIFPKKVVGSVTGFSAAMGGLAGVITTEVIGWTVQHLSFAPVFSAVAVVYLIAFAVLLLLIRELGKTIEFRS